MRAATIGKTAQRAKARAKKTAGKPYKGPGVKGKIHAVPDPDEPTVIPNMRDAEAPPPMDHVRVLEDVAHQNNKASEYTSNQMDALLRRIDETQRVVADAQAVVEERTRLLREAVAEMDMAQQKRFRAIAARETFRAVAFRA